MGKIEFFAWLCITWLGITLALYYLGVPFIIIFGLAVLYGWKFESILRWLGISVDLSEEEHND